MKWLLPAVFALCLCPLAVAKKPKDDSPQPSLTGQRVIIPATKGNATVAYWRPVDLEKMYRAAASESPEAAKNLEERLAGIRKGGRFSVTVETNNVQTANSRHFTLTVFDKNGSELKKVIGVDQKPVTINGRTWSTAMIFDVDQPGPGPLKVTVFNDFKKETTVYAVNLETGEVK